ncbi:hypothetical protein [Kyrpidia spormannii]|uniref:hypothetical protein n=1 Tax=Kyrpidia spormannii TaxID=2055160 RepID=UPI001E5BF059|nr:hypothetical protein [Kyrpidia spormannii]
MSKVDKRTTDRATINKVATSPREVNKPIIHNVLAHVTPHRAPATARTAMVLVPAVGSNRSTTPETRSRRNNAPRGTGVPAARYSRPTRSQ